MKLVLGKMGSGLAFALFSASTLGLLATTSICTARSFGGAHASMHHTPAMHSMHTSSHHSFTGGGHSHLNGEHGERGHFERGHEMNNSRHNEMSRRDGWKGRGEHNFNRGHETNNFRHNEMSRRDEMHRGDQWRGRNDRQRNFGRDEHQNHYLGQHTGQRTNTNTNNPETVLKGPKQDRGGNSNSFNPASKDAGVQQ